MFLVPSASQTWRGVQDWSSSGRLPAGERGNGPFNQTLGPNEEGAVTAELRIGIPSWAVRWQPCRRRRHG